MLREKIIYLNINDYMHMCVYFNIKDKINDRDIIVDDFCILVIKID